MGKPQRVSRRFHWLGLFLAVTVFLVIAVVGFFDSLEQAGRDEWLLNILLGWTLGMALLASVLMYGLIRAIGWIVGGFMAT